MMSLNKFLLVWKEKKTTYRGLTQSKDETLRHIQNKNTIIHITPNLEFTLLKIWEFNSSFPTRFGSASDLKNYADSKYQPKPVKICFLSNPKSELELRQINVHGLSLNLKIGRKKIFLRN